MWHHCWPNPFSRPLLVFALLFLWSTTTKGQERLPMGPLESIEELIDIQNRQFTVLKGQANANPVLINQVDSSQQIKLEERYARALIFSSEKRYLDLIRGDQCSLYALIENQLLRTPDGPINQLIVALKNEEQGEHHALMSRENFLEAVTRTKCFQNKDLRTIFNNSNIANTIQTLNFPVPKKRADCARIVNDWVNNPNTPYFCKVAEVIKRGETARLQSLQLEPGQIQSRRDFQALAEQYDFYTQNISHFHRTYLKNVCQNLDSAENFCQVYLADDVWNRILNGEVPTWKMSYRCREMANKEVVGMEELQGCAQQFNENPDICRTRGALNYSSLYPYFRCDTLSHTLLRSKLKTDYHDCPGQIDNEAIINTIRLLNHFDQPEQASTAKNCASLSLVRFAEMNIQFDNKDAWPLKICHEDKVNGGERCYPYVPGGHPDSELSEEKVVTDIMVRQFNMPRTITCKVTDVRDYNPNLLEFKSGCTILYDRDQCTTLYCPKKIFIEQKEVSELRYEGQAIFDYFPNSFRNERLSMVNVLRETLQLEVKSLRNLTELTVFLNQEGNGVVHGIGCAEDLLPSRFRRHSLNQCQPLPFIIDGIQTDDVITKLVVRYAIEDIHSPRLINWNHIFTAITHYQKLHPLDSWMMYGLRR